MYHDSNMLENANSTPSDPAIKAIANPLLINVYTESILTDRASAQAAPVSSL